MEQAVGPERDAVREMAIARYLGCLPPNDLEPVDPRRAAAEDQPPVTKHGAAAALAFFDVAKVDALVAGKSGMDHDIAKPALPGDVDLGHPAHRLALAGGGIYQPQIALALTDQRHVGQGGPAARQEVHRPRR